MRDIIVHDCWCSGAFCRQGISSKYIYIWQAGPCRAEERFSTYCFILEMFNKYFVCLNTIQQVKGKLAYQLLAPPQITRVWLHQVSWVTLSPRTISLVTKLALLPRLPIVQYSLLWFAIVDPLPHKTIVNVNDILLCGDIASHRHCLSGPVVQYYGNPNSLAMELLQSCTKISAPCKRPDQLTGRNSKCEERVTGTFYVVW